MRPYTCFSIFLHHYPTPLLENGCDVVTLQHQLAHSDIETTRHSLIIWALRFPPSDRAFYKRAQP
jgi:hypothetical protein